MYSNAITTVSPTYASEAVDGGAAGWLKSTFARPDVRAKFQVRRLLDLACRWQELHRSHGCSQKSRACAGDLERHRHGAVGSPHRQCTACTL